MEMIRVSKVPARPWCVRTTLVCMGLGFGPPVPQPPLRPRARDALRAASPQDEPSQCWRRPSHLGNGVVGKRTQRTSGSGSADC